MYGSPDLGNFADPNDEFAYIVLSRKTIEQAYRRSFAELKGIGSWDFLASLEEEAVEQVIHGCGLEHKKAVALLDGLWRIKRRFGRVDLARAHRLPDRELFSFLTSLPEVGPKSALCIMLYSFSRAVFPVDTHAGRILARLGTFTTLGIDLLPMNHKERQRELVDAIPPDCRYNLHVNLVAHGRALCKALQPLCDQCRLASLCSHAKTHIKNENTQPLTRNLRRPRGR